MYVAATSSSRSSGTFKQVLSSPLYRGATVAMFFSGLGASAAAPQIVLFLVKELGTPLPIAGLYYLTNLTAPIASYLVGNHSDRTGERLILFRLCALAGFAGWAAIALSTKVWMPFLISSLFLAFSVAASSQLFAAVRDDLDQEGQGSSEGVVAIVRMALTVGWVIGPMIGAWLAAAISLRAMLWMTALCALAQIIPLGTLKRGQVSGAHLRPAQIVAGPPMATCPDWNVLPPPSRWHTIRPLLAFTGLYVLVYAGESVKYGFLPLYMDLQLHLEPAVRGAVIGIQPLVELAIMPFCVTLGRRVGFLWLMSIGAAFGVAANICFATTANALGMFAGQILMGGVWGIFASLGIIAAQRLLPSAVATASAIFMSSTAVSSALGGLTGALGVATIGLPEIFFIPAAFAFLAVLGLAAMARSGALKSRPAATVVDGRS
jgi:MFS transporter, SET family, sugar efflux transporter